MAIPSDLRRYALYGEDNRAIAPEFIHIETISSRSGRYDGTIDAHSHPGIFQLLLLERGSGRLVSDGAVYELPPPTLVVLPSGAVHAFSFAAGTEGWVLSIASDLLAALRLTDRRQPHAVEEGSALALAVADGSRQAARLSWLLGEIAADLETGLGGRPTAALLASLTLLLSLADDVLDQEFALEKVLPGRAERGEQLARRFRQLVDRHFAQGWAVARYSAELGTTTPTLTRACRRSLDRSPSEVIHHRQLLEAMRALTYSSAPLSQIALDIGFTDPAYFARFFKARTGVTASTFRRERLWLEGAPFPGR
jgi:AraC family transcriptional activator of pobA